jgi:hypothetical protein
MDPDGPSVSISNHGGTVLRNERAAKYRSGVRVSKLRRAVGAQA